MHRNITAHVVRGDAIINPEDPMTKTQLFKHTYYYIVQQQVGHTNVAQLQLSSELSFSTKRSMSYRKRWKMLISFCALVFSKFLRNDNPYFRIVVSLKLGKNEDTKTK